MIDLYIEYLNAEMTIDKVMMNPSTNHESKHSNGGIVLAIITNSTLSRAHNLSGLPNYAGARRVMISVGDTH